MTVLEAPTAPHQEVAQVADPAPAAVPQLRQTSSVDAVVAEVAANLGDRAVRLAGNVTTPQEYTLRAAQHLLEHLAGLPGDTWQDRWSCFEQVNLHGGRWCRQLGYTGRPGWVAYCCPALGQLVRLDLVRPSYAWLANRHLIFWLRLLEWRDPAGTALFVAAVEAVGVTTNIQKNLVRILGWICAHTGKQPRQVSGADLQEMHLVLKSRGADAKGTGTLWSVLRTLGWLDDDAPILPQPTRRLRPKTPVELVDQYGIAEPHREVLIEYLKQRSLTLDHSSLINHNRTLVGLFWSDIARHHPDLTDFRLTHEQARAWRTRLDTKPDGTPRQNIHNILFAVRAFYLDLAEWSVTDSYWAQWVAPSPISRSDVSGLPKARRKVVARTQQRTRELVPLLPVLIAQAEKEKKQTAANLAAAQAVGHGGTVEVDGQTWTVLQPQPNSRVRISNDTGQRILTTEESAGFWTWAIIETLRHSGLRVEEMLELTHLAIQPYTIKPSGETIPLVHIPASKNDEERMLVASPELVHVLSAITQRIRNGNQAVPLTQRWDPHERVIGEPLPHLFVHSWNKTMTVLSMVTVNKYLNELAARANLTIGGRPVNFTPHDFRRIFATEALAAGLPPHIVQVLLGHKSLATTQGYAAIYPQDVIRHHRTFINTRRRTRPSEEYREPTPEEWAEFEAHFVQRKVSLGSCGRAYGTNCHHEHACIRCGLLRTDPAQIDRLRDIITNLRDRIEEAEQNNWLGEVEGLKISHAAAAVKLDQMERQLTSNAVVQLGLPTTRMSAMGPLNPPGHNSSPSAPRESRKNRD